MHAYAVSVYEVVSTAEEVYSYLIFVIFSPRSLILAKILSCGKNCEIWTKLSSLALNGTKGRRGQRDGWGRMGEGDERDEGVEL